MAGKYDELSFGKAFNAARKAKGKGKTFTWKGKSYTTNFKEEVEKPKVKPKARDTSKVVGGTKAAVRTSLRPKARPKSDVSGFTPEPVEVKSLVKGGRGDGRKETIKRRIRTISEKKKTTDKASNTSSAARKRGQVPNLKGAAWMKKNTFADYMALSKSEARALGLPATRVSASQHALRNQKFKDGRGFFKDSAPKASSGGRNNSR